MPAHFEVFEDTKGEFRWHLRSANGEIVAVSESYPQVTHAIRGVEDAKDAFFDALTPEIKVQPEEEK